MTSDNVFSGWRTPLETFFDKTYYSPHATLTRGEYNIPTSCTVRNQRKRRDKNLF